jgi:hypothetical protein
MEKLLTAYLYQYKNCPLPGIGSLLLNPGHAEFLPGQKRMLAPMPFIELSNKEVSTGSLLNFITGQKNINTAEAVEMLNNYCGRITQLDLNEELPFSSTGSFYKDDNGNLHFKTVSLPAAYFPEVVAERVIHPDVAHNILVGDTETNSTAMTELLNTGEEKKRSRWWIAAVSLGVIAAIALLIYFTHHNSGGMFGNIKPVKASQSSKTYLTPDK